MGTGVSTINDMLLRIVDGQNIDRDRVFASFGGEEAFHDSRAAVSRRERDYGVPKSHVDYFDPVVDRGGATLAEKFTAAYAGSWLADKRPSLPALAKRMMERSGLHADRIITGSGTIGEQWAVSRALILTALRAEMVKGRAPTTMASRLSANAYHDAVHTGAVAAVTEYLAFGSQRMNKVVPDIFLGLDERVPLLIAAFAHDIDHPGRPNGDDPIGNEEQAFRTIEPILKACGVSQECRDHIQGLIHLTSPNGPSALVGRAMAAFRQGRHPDVQYIDPEAKFLALAQRLTNVEFAYNAAILVDADLYSGFGAGYEAHRANTARLGREFRQAGIGVDVDSVRARHAYVASRVAEGFYTPVARLHFGDMGKDLLDRLTKERLLSGDWDDIKAKTSYSANDRQGMAPA